MKLHTAAAASAIWVIGAWLRLYGLHTMEFKGDERISLELAIQFINDHPWSSSQPWPSHGLISSNHIGNAPLFIWIVAPLWALAHHAVGVTAIIAAINALCLVPLWFWARRRMDEPRALLVLAIASVSPFAVLFSRKIWPVDLLLPGMLAVLWSIEWLREGRVWRALALAGFGVLLITQLHQSGVITAPLLLIAFAIQWGIDARRGLVRPPSRPSAFEMAAIVVVVVANVFFWWTYLPYLSTVPAEAFANRPRAASFAPQLLFNVISEIVPRHVLSPFFVEHVPFAADLFRGTLYFISLALGAPLAAYGVWRWLRAPFALPVVGIWWWLVVVAFAVARIPSHDYYVLAVMPLPIVLAAGAFDGSLSSAWSRALMVWRWMYVAVLLALTVVTGAWLTGRGGSRGDYGVTFEIQHAQAQTLLAHRRGESPNPNRRLGETAPEQRITLRCQKPSNEVIWIAEWLGSQPSSDVHAFQICDGWIGTGRDAVYRWAIRQAP
jgi:hypothetical protein